MLCYKLEGWVWRWVGGKFKREGTCYTYGWFTLLYGRNQHNIVKQSVVVHRASLVAQMEKRLPAMRETQVRSLCWEDLLEKEMATHSSILAWRIPRMEEHGRLQSMGSQRVGHDWVTSLSDVYNFVTPWTAAHQASLFFTISQSLFRPMSIESMMQSNHLILCQPLSCPQSFPALESFPMSWLFVKQLSFN